MVSIYVIAYWFSREHVQHNKSEHLADWLHGGQMVASVSVRRRCFGRCLVSERVRVCVLGVFGVWCPGFVLSCSVFASNIVLHSVFERGDDLSWWAIIVMSRDDSYDIYIYIYITMISYDDISLCSIMMIYHDAHDLLYEYGTMIYHVDLSWWCTGTIHHHEV